MQSVELRMTLLDTTPDAPARTGGQNGEQAENEELPREDGGQAEAAEES